MNTRDREMRCGPQGRWRQRALALGLVLFATAILATPGTLTRRGYAQEEGEGTAVSALEAKLNEKGSITLRDATLVEWLFAIQGVWGVDIVAGNELQNDVVNGAFKDTTLREVLTSILFARGYGYRQVGSSLLITRLNDMPIKPDQRTAIIPLDFHRPEEVESSVRMLLSQSGKVQAVTSSKSLFVIDSPEVIESVRRFLQELEQYARKAYEIEQARLRAEQQAAGLGPNNSATPGADGEPVFEEIEEHTKVFALQYMRAEDMAEVISTVVSSARATPLSTDGKLVITASDRDLTIAEALIAQLDIPRKQVRITAYMYDVNVEVMERLGFNWSNMGRGRINGSGDPQSLLGVNSNSVQPNAVDTSGMTPAQAAVAAATSSSVGSLFTLGHFSRSFDLTATIQALETTDGSRLLARPNIVAYDMIQASFQSVQEIPVQQLTQTAEGGNIGTTEFREAGITLSVTPRIMADDSILLQVTPEFSVLNGFNNGQPIIDRRQATTTLKLLNGQAAVIGGLVRRNEIETDSGVPGLLHWKHIGRLFRGHEATVTESELVVFIRAEVIETSFPGDPRDQMAHTTIEELLNQIPYATPAPVVADCTDPYCPLHNPRPRFVGDYPMDAKCSHGYPHGTPVQGHAEGNVYSHQSQPTPAPPTSQAPMTHTPPVSMPPAPQGEMRPTPPVGVSQQQPFEAQPTPAIAPNPAPSNEPPAVEPGPAYNTEGEALHIPPPVIIDEMARRYRSGRVQMTRLPSVNSDSVRQAEQPAPIVVRPSRQATAPVNPARTENPRTANGTGRMQPLPPVQPSTRTATPPPRKNWLENLFQR